MEYKDVLEEVEDQPTLILGNGFSLAYSQKFSYTKLAEKMTVDHEGEEEAIQAFMYIVENLNVVDVEKILGHIGFVVDFLKEFPKADCGERDCIMRSLGDYKKTITTVFAKAFSELHPERFANPNAHDKDQSPLREETHILRQTLDTCHTIFTLNYDLLLHWLAANYEEQTSKKFVDAFYLDEPLEKDCKKIYYLHGAMHLFEKKGVTSKLKAGGPKDLTSRISSAISHQKILPTIILEGKYKDKLHAIHGNKYLNYCYEQLKDIEGPVIIYGLSVPDDQKDKHIIDAIIDNKKITKIYLSKYDDSHTERFQARITARIGELNKNKETAKPKQQKKLEEEIEGLNTLRNDEKIIEFQADRSLWEGFKKDVST